MNYGDPAGTEPITLALLGTYALYTFAVAAIAAAGIGLMALTQTPEFQAAWGSMVNQINAWILDSINTISSSMSQRKAKKLVDTIGGIAASYGLYQCVEAAKDIEEHLIKKKLDYGVIIGIAKGRPYIYSNIRGKTISENGYHIGIIVKGVVFCNIHFYGLPQTAWKNDFDAALGMEYLVFTNMTVKDAMSKAGWGRWG